MVRPGIILYGLVPFKDEVLQKRFKPVMTLKTKITFIKNIDNKKVQELLQKWF